jgi:hypothetical protein
MNTMDTKDTKDTKEIESLNKYIDACIFNSTHYDIAFVAHKYLKDKHRYVKNNTWEYLADTEWIADIKNQHLAYSIRTIVCSAFTQRSLYWANAKDAKDAKDDSNYPDNSKYPDIELISNKLLLISLKLKENKYISILIKECKQFFV